MASGSQGGRKYFTYDGQIFEDGCLVKTMAVRNLRHDDSVLPSIAELERFRAGLGDGADDALLSAMPAASGTESFAPGDVVKVRDGELKHVVGVVKSISADGASVIVIPTSTDSLLKSSVLKHGLSFTPESLQKWFKMGDHVKVVGGSRHVGETGLIVRVGKSEEGAEQIDQLYVETATWPP